MLILHDDLLGIVEEERVCVVADLDEVAKRGGSVGFEPLFERVVDEESVGGLRDLWRVDFADLAEEWLGHLGHLVF